jgi:hypothetical protein
MKNPYHKEKIEMTPQLDALLQSLQDNHNASFCLHYGEPGYEDPKMGILLCDWNPISHENMDMLEAEGYSLEWSDEWVIDYDNNKAYRTSPDSYDWQPSVWWNDDGQMFTPDDDASDWIDAMVDNPRMALPSRITQTDLEEAGFSKYSDHEESGLHTGMDADPKERFKEIKDRFGDDCEVVFRMTEVSQFYVVWESYARPAQTDEDEPGEEGDAYEERKIEERYADEQALASAGWGTNEDYNSGERL